MLTSQDRYMGRVIGYAFSYVIFAVWAIHKVLLKPTIRFSNHYWKYALRISPPLIAHGLSLIALSQIDRIMLTNMRGASETGVYSIVYSMSMITLALAQALESIWIPWFTEKYEKKEYRAIDLKAKLYLWLFASIMGIIMLLSPEVLMLLTPREYWSGISIIPPLVLSSFLIYSYSYYVGLELHEKKSKTVSIGTVTATIINIVLNLILIPLYGMVAAAFTTLISYAVLLAIHFVNGRRINSAVFGIKNMIGPIIVLLVITVLYYILADKTAIRVALCGGFAISLFVITRYRGERN